MAFLWATVVDIMPIWIQNKIFQYFNTLRPRQNGRHFADNIFKCIFGNENVWISIRISLKFVPVGPINNIPALVQIMAWRLPGDKPLSEPMLVCLPRHICITQPQWVKDVNKLLLCKFLEGISLELFLTCMNFILGNACFSVNWEIIWQQRNNLISH